LTSRLSHAHLFLKAPPRSQAPKGFVALHHARA
jgi:hypothetical protein